MSDRDVGMGEMHGFNDETVDAVLTGRTAGGASDVAAFVGELRHAYAAEAVPAPTQALSELFTRGLSTEEAAPAAPTPRRSRVLAPFNRLGTAAKAALVGAVIVGASSGLAAADLLPQPVDDTVSNVVPFVATDSDDDDGTLDEGPGDAPGTPGSDEDDDDTTTPTVDDDQGEDDDSSGSDDSSDDDGETDDDDSGTSDNSGPGSVNSGSDDDDDDDSPTSTPTTVDDDDDSTVTTIDDDDDEEDSTVTTIDDDSSDDDSASDDSSDDHSGSGSDDSGTGSSDD